MKQKFLLTFLLIASLSGHSCAQKEQPPLAAADSLTLVRGPWKTDTVEGMVLKTIQFSHQEYLSSNQYISIIELPAGPQHSGHRHALSFSYRPQRTLTSRQAADADAVAAVNGSFFDMDHDNPICYLRIGGKEISENLPGTDTANRKYYQTGTLCLRYDGSVTLLRTEPAIRWEHGLTAYPDVMTAGPLLIYHDTLQPMRTDRTFVSQRHNRTALGITANGTILLIAVDGRAKEAAGMTMNELSATLHYLGCVDAVNLDGGGSTTLWVKGQPQGGIVNYPSDNGRFDRKGERKVSSCILVKSLTPKNKR